MSHLLSGIERVSIDGRLAQMPSEQDARWLEVFRPFTSVQNMWISGKGLPRIVLVLERLSGELATNVLSALRDLYLWKASGSEKRDLGRFITARQCSNHPVAVHYLEEKWWHSWFRDEL
jgi:hypothetical protein